MLRNRGGDPPRLQDGRTEKLPDQAQQQRPVIPVCDPSSIHNLARDVLQRLPWHSLLRINSSSSLQAPGKATLKPFRHRASRSGPTHTVLPALRCPGSETCSAHAQTIGRPPPKALQVLTVSASWPLTVSREHPRSPSEKSYLMFQPTAPNLRRSKRTAGLAPCLLIWPHAGSAFGRWRQVWAADSRTCSTKLHTMAILGRWHRALAAKQSTQGAKVATSETCGQHKLDSIRWTASPTQGTAPRTSMAECCSKQKAAPGLWLGRAPIQLAGRKACVCPQQGGPHALQAPATVSGKGSTRALSSSLCRCTLSVQSIVYVAHGASADSRASDRSLRFFRSCGQRT